MAYVKFWSNSIENIRHLYIHFPFCASKCRYCSFYSIEYSPDYYELYIKSLKNEFDYYSDLYDFSELSTIYVGGGNPCVNEELTSDINKILSPIPLSSIKEYTIEGNPVNINSSIVCLLKDNYINRVSLGVQSFTDKALTFANRLFQMKDIVDNSLSILNERFTNISIDIINCLPYADIERDTNEIGRVIDQFDNVRHISFYDLSIDEGTVFYDKRFALNIKELEKKRNRYEKKFTELISGYNFNRYEVSNYSQNGFESLHNLGYWKYKNFLGLGPSAHSLIDNLRIENSPDFGLYVSDKNGKFSYKKNIRLTKVEQIEEYLMMGLRLVEGINIKDINDRFEIDLLKILENIIENLVKSKLLILDNNSARLKTTTAGMQTLNKILVDIFLHLEES
ncbi:MAG TPA: radical SAM family heme chaperone HemW [Spirochaetota bacterium]|nr:MAG: Oxygen-independent coproporphyrinogen-III oxidase 1 [Spirochaetes bacterium ADurb.Bin133]HNZ27419.1 radical SAM family heme chaperone HemW [Spirochaetota bacterium]